MGGSSKSSETTQKSEPWGAAQPDLLAGLAGSRGLFAADPYGDALVAPRDPLSVEAENATLAHVASGQSSAGSRAGQEAITGILGRGEYGGTDTLMDRIQTNVQPRIDTMFSRAGRTNSSAHADTMTRAMTEAAAPALASLYQNETGNTLRAAGMAPAMDQAAMADFATLDGIGRARQGQLQREIDAPHDALDRYFNYATRAGGMGGTSTGRQQQPGAGIGGILGGGLTGAGVGSQFGPMGTLIGGGLGVLGGLF